MKTQVCSIHADMVDMWQIQSQHLVDMLCTFGEHTGFVLSLEALRFHEHDGQFCWAEFTGSDGDLTVFHFWCDERKDYLR